MRTEKLSTREWRVLQQALQMFREVTEEEAGHGDPGPVRDVVALGTMGPKLEQLRPEGGDLPLGV